MIEKHLLSPAQIGAISLQNRVVMAPMTRCRTLGNVPNTLMVEYYKQRSGAGLIITEGTSPSQNGLGYARIPGIFNQAQVKAGKTSRKRYTKPVAKFLSSSCTLDESAIRSICRLMLKFWRPRL